MAGVVCHTAVAPRIYPTAEQAVDRAIAAGLLSSKLPFIRREGVRLLKAHDSGSADPAIAPALRAFYSGANASADAAAVRQAILRLQHLHKTNVFPTMKVTWGVYRD